MKSGTRDGQMTRGGEVAARMGAGGPSASLHEAGHGSHALWRPSLVGNAHSHPLL